MQDERVRRATMHINRKPGEQIEVDWAGDPAYIIDSETGEQKKACLSNTTKSPSKRRRAAEKDCPRAGNARADQAEGCGVGNPGPAQRGTPVDFL